MTHAEVDVPEDADGDDFLPDSDDEAEDAVVETGESGGVVVEDSDGEDDNADEQVENTPKPSPEPEPEPVKKRVVKRKVVKKTSS